MNFLSEFIKGLDSEGKVWIIFIICLPFIFGSIASCTRDINITTAEDVQLKQISTDYDLERGKWNDSRMENAIAMGLHPYMAACVYTPGAVSYELCKDLARQFADTGNWGVTPNPELTKVVVEASNSDATVQEIDNLIRKSDPAWADKNL